MPVHRLRELKSVGVQTGAAADRLKDGQLLRLENLDTDLLPDGKFHLKAEYRKNGQWTFGREVTYEESPGSKVIFK